MEEAWLGLSVPDSNDGILPHIRPRGRKQSGIFGVKPVPCGRSAPLQKTDAEQKQAEPDKTENGWLRLTGGGFHGVWAC